VTLVLEIEYLSGVSFAAVSPDSEVPDWPPQPDRVFSALVAAWGARGKRPREAEALEWLERQATPYIYASNAHARTAPVAFVPPNDARSEKKAAAKHVMPALRPRYGRRFVAARPHDAVVQFRWDSVEADERTLTLLDGLARDVVYVGHSTSLTRCRFLSVSDSIAMRNETGTVRRRVYPGRFDELRRDFEAGRRPRPGDPAAAPVESIPSRSNHFGERWLILEHINGVMPDIRACSLVARAIRDTILSGYERVGLETRIPEVVSGHTRDGAPSRDPHIALVPLPFAGFPHADGHVMGFALIPPQESGILDDPDFRNALRAVAPMDEERGRRVMTVQTKAGAPAQEAFSLHLSPSFESMANRRSMDPALYNVVARDFATVTPIVLDRHLKAKGAARDQEMCELIARACVNIGLPEPDRVVPDKHASLEGVPSAYPSGQAPRWMRWKLSPTLASRQLTHAFLRFRYAVHGPVILGAGRHFGLGLCRALPSGEA
jgi:CRISPR-associated protein Csb2